MAYNDIFLEVSQLQEMIRDNKINELNSILPKGIVEWDMLTNQWLQLMRDNSLGILSQQEFTQERNKIVYRYLTMVDTIKKNISTNGFLLNYSILASEYYNQSELNALSEQSLASINTVAYDIKNTESLKDVKLLNDISNYHPDLKKLESRMDWANRGVKDKIKITLPFFFIKWENKYDMSNFKFPSSLAEFRSMLIKR